MAFWFDERCDGCSACMRQCPTAAIYKSGERFQVDPRACIDCGVCGAICAREAVLDGEGMRQKRVPRDRRARPVLSLDRCNGCGVCVRFCPYDCLQVVGRAHFGVCHLSRPLACVSCNECATACIKGAIQMEAVDLRKLDPDRDRADAEAYLASGEES